MGETSLSPYQRGHHVRHAKRLDCSPCRRIPSTSGSMTRNDVTMLTDLQRLIRLEPLPQNPVGTSLGDADWRDVEAVLGYRLPHDYKDYIAAYGAGRWADFLGIMSPFYRWRHPQALDFFDWIRSRLDGLDEIHQTFP